MIYKLCYTDVETTGLDHKRNGLIQMAGSIYYLEGENYEKKEEFNFKIKTFEADEIADQALVVNKITREEIALYPDPKQVHSEFNSLLDKYVDRYNKADKLFFVGYNARFDYDFVRSFYEKCNDKYFGSFFFFPPVDVMNYAIVHLMEKRHELPNFKLATVADYFGVKPEGDLHDAFVDIEITRLIFEKLLNLRKV